MDNYFKRAGELEEPKYFERAGDLEIKEPNYFERAGDIEEPKINYFKPARNPESAITEKEIKDYLLTVVSGKKYGNEFGSMPSGGRMIVSFNQLKEMVDTGYNIINAKYINQNMIEIEFEYCEDKASRKGR